MDSQQANKIYLRLQKVVGEINEQIGWLKNFRFIRPFLKIVSI
jgi:hypothetical protein